MKHKRIEAKDYLIQKSNKESYQKSNAKSNQQDFFVFREKRNVV